MTRLLQLISAYGASIRSGPGKPLPAGVVSATPCSVRPLPLALSAYSFGGNFRYSTKPVDPPITSSSTNGATATPSAILITTPIYYVNADPHIGHLFSSVLADSLARYHRLRGRTVVFSTGTDEHGTKIQQAAAQAQVAPGPYCDRISARFKELCQAAQVQYDDFIRTTEPRHRQRVQSFWAELAQRGHIYKGTYSGWYSVSDEAFYTAEEVTEVTSTSPPPPAGVADGTSPPRTTMVATVSGSTVEWTEETNYKFRLGSFIPALLRLYEQHPDMIVPANRYQDVMAQLRSYPTGPAEAAQGDLSISRPRARLNWGIPVPGDPDHTIYVWLDALLNYLTVAESHPVNGQPPFPPHLQIVGKDIVKFHAIFWPAFLLATGRTPTRRIVAHAHWTMANHKMSKSRGNVADPFAVLNRHGVDSVRYFLLRNGGLAYDADFSEARIQVDYQSQLVDQLGNLVARCASQAFAPDFNSFGQWGRKLSQTELPMVKSLKCVANAYEQPDVRLAINTVHDAVAHLNKYVALTEPWKLKKALAQGDLEAQLPLQRIVFLALETARLAAVLLLPVIPTKATELLLCLGIPPNEHTWREARLGAGWQDAAVDYNTLAESRSKVIFPRVTLSPAKP
ncbi:tRNA synthetases class I (M)-domain-containing protein [Dimargaris cristalligena]|uniref:methionine--tRNA ligase n=1 Tax=Dimargaris cristalligena TaxID=215637 RepID=A0A4P9ZZH1_9FUNG|nr:tRNA synthetases class I (M)-domain-containing protein [Dimargaris cristalligena]|eukprot:RKP38352.1 tRNA synthetases class I (M)-domain-containing protein [Dimargaris cristalligena]